MENDLKTFGERLNLIEELGNKQDMTELSGFIEDCIGPERMKIVVSAMDEIKASISDETIALLYDLRDDPFVVTRANCMLGLLRDIDSFDQTMLSYYSMFAILLELPNLDDLKK